MNFLHKWESKINDTQHFFDLHRKISEISNSDLSGLDDKVNKCLAFIENCVEKEDSEQNEKKFEEHIKGIQNDHKKHNEVGFLFEVI